MSQPPSISEGHLVWGQVAASLTNHAPLVPSYDFYLKNSDHTDSNVSGKRSSKKITRVVPGPYLCGKRRCQTTWRADRFPFMENITLAIFV